METREDSRIYEALVSRGSATKYYDSNGYPQYEIIDLGWMNDLDGVREEMNNPKKRRYLLIA